MYFIKVDFPDPGFPVIQYMDLSSLSSQVETGLVDAFRPGTSPVGEKIHSNVFA
jgi:hypothetical protein